MVIVVPLFVMSIVKKVETKKPVTASGLFVPIVLLLTGIVISSAYVFGMKMKTFVLIAITAENEGFSGICSPNPFIKSTTPAPLIRAKARARKIHNRI